MSHVPTGRTAADGIHQIHPAKTSAAATFALIFGLSALLSVLTLLLTPLALVLAVIGLVLGIAGIKMSKRVGVTGRALAITGLVMSVLTLLLGVATIVGVATFLNNDAAVTRLEQQVQGLRDQLPTEVDVPTPGAS
jgi:amino acid transporter